MMNREIIYPSDVKLKKKITDSANEEIRPIWEEKKISWTSRLLFFSFVISIICEIVGNNTSYNSLKISNIIKKSSSNFANIFIKLGYYLAKFSDILYFLKYFLQYLYDFIYPIVNAIYIAVFDISNSIMSFFTDIILYFFDGYNLGMEDVYNKLSAYGVSWILLFTIPVLVLTIFESIGINLKAKTIRPTYYIIGVANNVYYLIMNISYLYGIFIKILTRLNEVVYDIIQYIFPWIKPIIDKLHESNIYVVNSINNFAMAPFIGSVKGFVTAISNNSLLDKAKNNFSYSVGIIIMIACFVYLTITYFI